MSLATRWFPLPKHEGVQGFLNSTARFNVVPAGRRSYKTETAKRRAIIKAFTPPPVFRSRICLCAPTRDQAKKIFWEDLKLLIPRKYMRSEPMETELRIEVNTGYNIYVVGMDKPERIEGDSPLLHVVLDEYANMKESAWPAHVFPALTDFGGTADFVGVPEGRNHYYKLFQKARAARDKGIWLPHQWTSEELLSPEEIAIAKEDMDELTYRQEFLADFVSFEGGAYYSFNSAEHETTELPYYPNDPIVFCFDFNVSPGVAVVLQEARGINRTLVIDEIYIPKNSKTTMVCDALLEGVRGSRPYRNHRGEVHLYGDATGGADGTAKVEGSDWDLIQKKLKPVFGDRLYRRVPKANPRERARVNAVNTRFKAMDGTIRMLVDGQRCSHLIQDLEGVLVDGSGAIDKKKHKDDGLTHISDALGYYVVKRWPVKGGRTLVRQEIL